MSHPWLPHTILFAVDSPYTSVMRTIIYVDGFKIGSEIHIDPSGLSGPLDWNNASAYGRLNNARIGIDMGIRSHCRQRWGLGRLVEVDFSKGAYHWELYEDLIRSKE